MDFEDFRNLVERTKKSHPVWFGLESDCKPVGGAISDAESELGVRLPEDYKNFINEFGGGYFAFSNVYSLEIGSDWNLVDVNFKYDSIRDGHVIISENGSGDFYGFKVIDSVCNPEIYFYDHETGLWETTSHDNLFDYLGKCALTN